MEKRGNEDGTSTQNVRKVGAEPKANSGSRAGKGTLHLSVQTKELFL